MIMQLCISDVKLHFLYSFIHLCLHSLLRLFLIVKNPALCIIDIAAVRQEVG